MSWKSVMGWMSYHNNTFVTLWLRLDVHFQFIIPPFLSHLLPTFGFLFNIDLCCCSMGLFHVVLFQFISFPVDFKTNGVVKLWLLMFTLIASQFHRLENNIRFHMSIHVSCCRLRSGFYEKTQTNHVITPFSFFFWVVIFVCRTSSLMAIMMELLRLLLDLQMWKNA